MSKEGAPAEVLSFIDRHIESVEHLEILLLLLESPAPLSPAEILQQIQSSSSSVELRLGQLEAAGLVIKDAEGRFSFNAGEEKQRAVVAELAECYRQMRVRIIEAIYSRKTDAVQTFADAFKFRKE